MPDNTITKVDSYPVHHSGGKSDSNYGCESNGLVASSPYEFTDAPLNTRTDKIDAPNNTKKKELVQFNEPSTLINKESSSQENLAYDPDDGAWETARGRRRSKNVSPVVQQNTKSSTNSNTNNTNGQHNDGTSVHIGRVRRQKRCKDKNRNNNNTNQHYSNNNHQNKMIKDVILHILDAVDVEIRAMSIEGNRNSNSNTNLPHNSNGRYRRHQSNNVESSTKLPLQSMVSNSSTKSLRDVVKGTSSATAAAAILSKDSLTVGQANGASGKTEQPSNGSSKVKPGMSYKSVMEPAAVSQLSQTPPQQHKPTEPKPNAWAKPPSDIKVKKNEELKKKVEVKPNAAHSLPEKPGKNSWHVGSSVAEEGNEKRLFTTSCNGETQHRHSVSTLDDDGSPPPLATLLGPGTSYSTSSSVASSLEAPHSSANRFRHQASTNNTEDDVGYHLLNVCGQLSEEINMFMSRRALALDVRRKERNAVLNALGDTLTVSHISFLLLPLNK